MKHSRMAKKIGKLGQIARGILSLALLIPILASNSQAATVATNQVATIESSAFLVGAGNYFAPDYRLANVFCRILKKQPMLEKRGCKAIGGTSLENIYDLDRDNLDFAIIEEGWIEASQARQENRDSRSFEKIYRKLRRVMGLPEIYFGVFVARGVDVSKLSDLSGKRVNLGLPGSPARDVTELLMENLGVKKSDFAESHEYDQATQLKMACQGKLDVVPVTFSPNHTGYLQKLSDCGWVASNFRSDQFDRLVDAKKAYTHGRFNLVVAENLSLDMEILKIGKALVTTEDQKPEVIYQFLKDLEANMKQVNAMDPNTSLLTPEVISKDPGYVAYHPASLQYFKEQAWR